MPDLRDELQSTLSGTYTIERELGGGGMSRVFVAHEQALGRKVVVKVLPPETSAGVNVDRFRREIQLAAKLQHAHIVPVLSAGDIESLPYYTMPFVDGESLRARLAKDGALPMTMAIGILRDVAKALAYAHERGVVHRDIKPDNILLAGGSAVVADFGIAKAIAAAQDSPNATAGLTAVGTSIGTPAYMAPEQAAADPATDHRADIYSFGCVAYELLAGRPPFVAPTPQRLLAAHMAEQPQAIRELRADTPTALADLVMRCLEKEVGARPQRATDLIDVLETATTSGAAHDAMPALLLGGPAMLRKALALYAGAFVFVALVAKAAIVGIGLPDWVFPGALIVMALGLPGILFTGYVQRVARQAITRTPTLTPGGSTPSQSTIANIAVKASPHLSWRRVAFGGVLAVGGFVVLVGAYMVLRAFGIGPAGSLLGAGTFKNRDRLVVADFRVRGADSSLAGVVGEAIRSALSQSSVVSALAPAQIQASLTRMQRPLNTRLDLALAREVAQREGAKAVVDGEVTPLGAGFVVSLRLIGADSAQELASFRETADSPKELLATIDKLTRALRGKIGESLRAINANPPLDQVTTTSLQALQLYTAGSAANSLGDYTEAAKLLRQAVSIDTTFAMAYRKLSVAMSNGRMNPDSMDAMLEAAYRHRDRLTDLERQFTIGTYWDSERHYDRAKSIEAYETLVQRYPNEYGAWLNLGNLYRDRRDFVRADSAHRRSEALNRLNNFALFNPVGTRLQMGDISGARERLAHARQVLPNNPRAIEMEARILYAERKYDSSYAKFGELRQTRSDLFRGLAFGNQSLLDAMLGRLATMRRSLTDFRATEAARGRPAPPLEGAMISARIDSWYLNEPAKALKTIDSALARTPLASLTERDRPYLPLIELYATLGRPDRARAILAQLDEADARDTTKKRIRVPERHEALAWIALVEKRPLDAVSEFRKSDSLPDGPASACVGCIQAFVARAFDAASLPDSALAAYAAYVDAPSAFQMMFINDFNLGPALKRLGELYEAKGDRAKAAAYYQRFIELWKGADPELQPHVAEVRRRLIRLRDTER